MARQKGGTGSVSGTRSLIANSFALGRYKRNQGRVTRQLTAAAFSLIVLFGTYTLYHKILAEANNDAQLASMIAVPITFVGLWLIFRAIHWPRFADFLISVEAEMDKVTWSDWGELKRATAVVLITMLILTSVLFVFDVIWQKLFTNTGILF